MRLYLSSFRLGRHADKLIALVGAGRAVGIVANALDHLPAEDRRRHVRDVYDPHAVFRQLGFDPSDVDLRAFAGEPAALGDRLRACDLVWVLGGNVFVLRRAMRVSGFDAVIERLLKEDAVAYGGFSAGTCVLAPTLRGLELCDDPHAVGDASAVVWDGLGIIDVSIAPHYRSDHPEAPAIDRVVATFERTGLPYRTLRDGDVLIRQGADLVLHSLETGQPDPLDRNKVRDG